MNLKGIEKDDKNLVTLTVEIDAESLAGALALVFKRDAAKYNVPGFRRGKATRGMIERVYGKDVFTNEAAKLLIPEALDRAVDESGLEMVGDPKVEVGEVTPEGFTFTASVYVYPEAQVGAYKGLRAYKPPVEVGASDIDKELAQMQERNARLVTVQRGAQISDIVTLDFEGNIDDIPFEGGKAENFQLEIGSGAFIPGFEEQLVGKSDGDSCRINATFPDDYHKPELAGKEAVFQVAVHEVKERELPDLDDEFARDVSSFDTLRELRHDLQGKLESRSDEASQRVFEDAIVRQLLDNTVVEIPEPMISEQQSVLLEDFSRKLSAQGIDFDKFMSYSGRDTKDFLGELRGKAVKQLTLRLAWDKIAELEGLEVSDEEIAAEYDEVAKQYGMDTAEVMENIPEKSIRRDILRDKAIKLVKENAIVDEKPREEVVIPTVTKTEE